MFLDSAVSYNRSNFRHDINEILMHNHCYHLLPLRHHITVLCLLKKRMRIVVGFCSSICSIRKFVKLSEQTVNLRQQKKVGLT